MQRQILIFGSLSAAQMALFLVYIQYPAHLCVQPFVELRQDRGYILVYGGFADSEYRRGIANGAAVL